MEKALDFFQLACMAFFLVVFVGRTLHLRFGEGINPIKLGVGKTGLRRIVELSFVLVLLVWIVEVLVCATRADFRIFPSSMESPLIAATSVRLAGAGMIALAFIIFIWALVSFKDSWRIGIDKETQGRLVTTGIFSVSRNPIFLFIDLYFVGTFLINGTIVFLIFAAVVVAGIHYQILEEERYLRSAYGTAYAAYNARTRRYLGRGVRQRFRSSKA
jgi:protein-S-isoprenylcysteine O-methyltransferase Ste14